MVITPSTYRGGWLSRLFNGWQWGGINNARRVVSYLYGSGELIFVDKDNLFQAYVDCPHLNVVINRRAEMLSNGLWKCVKDSDDEEQEEIPNDPGLELLKNPNPLQRTNGWLLQYSIYRDIFSTNFIYPLRASSVSEPTCLWHLPSDLMKLKTTGKIFKQSKLEDIIAGFVLCTGDKEEFYKTQDIIYNVTNPGNDLIGQSKILALKYPVSNIMAALKTRNKLIVDKGVIGILSNDTSDADGGKVSLDPTEKKRIEEHTADRHNLYSPNNTSFLVTDASLKFSPMSYPVKDLMLLEECEDDFAAIIGAYGLDRDIFPSVKGATFENKQQGMRASYEHGIQPTADDLAQVVTIMLKGKERGVKYVLDYSWLPVMQEDAHTAAEREATKSTSLHVQFADGAITINEYRAELGKDELPEKDATQSQLEKIINAQVELRGTVGGTTGLIAINTAVSIGQLDRDAAVAIVVNVFGFEPAVADTMVTRTVNPPEPKQPLNAAA